MKLVGPIEICLNETYNKVHIVKNLSYTFAVQICLKPGGTLSPLVF